MLHKFRRIQHVASNGAAKIRAIQNYSGLVVEIVGVRLNNPFYIELQFHDKKGLNLLTKAPLH